MLANQTIRQLEGRRWSKLKKGYLEREREREIEIERERESFNKSNRERVKLIKYETIPYLALCGPVVRWLKDELELRAWSSISPVYMPRSLRQFAVKHKETNIGSWIHICNEKIKIYTFTDIVLYVEENRVHPNYVWDILNTRFLAWKLITWNYNLTRTLISNFNIW